MAPVKELGTQTMVTVRQLGASVGDNVGYYSFKKGPARVTIVAIRRKWTYIHPPIDEFHDLHPYFPDQGLVEHITHPENGRMRARPIPALKDPSLDSARLLVQAVYKDYPGFSK